MRQVPLESDINIAVSGCSGFATSTQKGPFTAMLISQSRGTYLIEDEMIANHHKKSSSPFECRKILIIACAACVTKGMRVAGAS